MPIGLQEIAALGIVLLVVGFALWRRWKRGRVSGGACAGCDAGDSAKTEEKTVHIYRRPREP